MRATPGVRRLTLSIAALGTLLCSCAGGMPLMHPAHVLEQGRTRFGAGAAANFVSGEASEAIEEARAAPPILEGPSQPYARGALASTALAPGVSPFVAARVGLGYGTEGGLAYAGRSLRIDARYALEGEEFAGSLGVGGSALLRHGPDTYSSEIAGLDTEDVKGFGVDVPLLVGWRSDADILWWWTGVRGGYERLYGDIVLVTPDPEQPVGSSLEARRLFASAVAGLAVGMRYFHVGVEVQGGYQDAEGTLWEQKVRATGLTLSPAAALLGSF